MVDKAVNMGHQALAITDENVMYGAVHFYKLCKSKNIKPIIGLTVSVLNEEEDTAYPLVLLAEDQKGYQNLLLLSSILKTNEAIGVSKDTLKKYVLGLIAISPFKGEVSQLLLSGDEEKAIKSAEYHKEIFGIKSFYLSIENHGLMEERQIRERLSVICKRLQVNKVVTNHVQYIEQTDALAQQCLLAIKNGDKLTKEQRNLQYAGEYYLKSPEDMTAIFIEQDEEALQNTTQIADRCNVEIDFDRSILPKYPVPAEYTTESYLRMLCEKGLSERYSNPSENVVERLNYELTVINKMNFNDYFLIVWDFMKFAHEQHILTGPGRGSAAGSLVAYTLKITNVDPIKHDLLFERFLNPDRISMPDIDIDFPDNKRDEMISYVAKKFGQKHVAQIITFGTLAARAAIRDIGRVLGLPIQDVDILAKQVPGRPGILLKEAYKESANLRKLIEGSDRYQQLYEIALKVEGLPRHTSIHAAGVVISDVPLVKTVPLQVGHDQIYLTQFSMEVLEDLGLLKMDFLGLRNLTLIENIIRMIERNAGQPFDLDGIPIDDTKTYQLLSKGDSTGVFQLESPGMRKVLQRLKPTEFEDIVAVNALYRPGPMENIPLYIERKHGKKEVSYPHEDLKSILQKTYGVIVYQEQIMQIASKLAGFTLGEADLLRRAVSKKKRDILEEERGHFVKGCLNNGYSEATAEQIYDLIVRFADYGFNRSHAVAYSMIAYQLAYLKANYPHYFMAAILTSVIGNDKKVASYINEAKQYELNVFPPSINKSTYVFNVEKEGIRFSLAAIKNVGITAFREITMKRKERRFADLFDFCARVSLKVVNRRVIESLTCAGCFDEFNKDRAVILASIDAAMEYAELVTEGDDGLFLGDDLVPKPEYIEVSEMPNKDKLKMEKEVLGFYLTSHPLESYLPIIKVLKRVQLQKLSELPPKTNVSVVGFISSIKTIKTKKGDQMAFITISDESGEVDGVIFPKVYNAFGAALKEEVTYTMNGTTEIREDQLQLVVNEIVPLHIIEQEMNAQLYLKIDENNDTAMTLKRVKSVLKKHSGYTKVVLYYATNKQTVKLSDEWLIKPSDHCLEELKGILGKNNVVLK